MTVTLADLHDSHGDVVVAFGALMGCTVCWRVVGFKCGDVTFAGRNACVPNLEVTALADHYWRQARTAGDDAAVDAIVDQFRAALRGQGRGGRHASGT